MKSFYGESKQSFVMLPVKQAGVTAGRDSVNLGRPISYLLGNSDSQLDTSEAGRSAYKRLEATWNYQRCMTQLWRNFL